MGCRSEIRLSIGGSGGLVLYKIKKGKMNSSEKMEEALRAAIESEDYEAGGYFLALAGLFESICVAEQLERVANALEKANGINIEFRIWMLSKGYVIPTTEG